MQGAKRLGRAGAVGTGEVLSAGMLVVHRIHIVIAVLVMLLNVALVGWCR